MSTNTVRNATAATINAAMDPEVLKKAQVDLEDALWLHRQPRDRLLHALRSFRGAIILHRVQAYFMQQHAATAQPISA